jgi:hypothetical protein
VKPPIPTERRTSGLRALGRLKPGSMNRTEEAYARELHEAVMIGDVLWFKFEGFKLRLADNTFYTPDFAVVLSTRELECHEVKGFWQEDARVKIKVAAEMYPFRFVAVQALSKKQGGGWKREVFG